MQPSITVALSRAFFIEWAETGYAMLSLERVAKRAGVGKAALYRRWPSKIAMAGDRLAAVGALMTEIADTGSLEGDVHALLVSLRRALRHPIVRRILPDLHAETARSSDLASAIRPFQLVRRRYVADIVNRAVARGELSASTDPDLVADLIGAPLYWRMTVIGGVSNRRYIDMLAHAAYVGIKTLGSSEALDEA